MPDPKHATIPLPTLPHSGLCDAALKPLDTGQAAGPPTTAPAGVQCTCAAGLLRLVGGK